MPASRDLRVFARSKAVALRAGRHTFPYVQREVAVSDHGVEIAMI